MPDIEQMHCGRLDCEVASAGICAEGHSPAKSCPFYGKVATGDYDDEGSSIEEGEEPVEEDQVKLPLGELLSPEEVDQWLCRQGVTFVTIVGDSDSGKTTLVCSLYERFLKGPFAGQFFAGSRTLIGLERRSHYSRMDSGRIHPDTPRTSISQGLRFFHLALATGSNTRRVDLMLSERAGETYRRARSNPALVPDLVEVKKADRLVLLLDGGRVVEPANRAGALQSVRQTLRAFLDGGGIGKRTRVQVVTTKVDLLERNPEKDAIKASIHKFKQFLAGSFASKVEELSFWDVSARDPSGEFAPAYGLDALFIDWVAQRPVDSPRTKLIGRVTTEFDKLLLRTPMEAIP
jgi:hypothetical protein